MLLVALKSAGQTVFAGEYCRHRKIGPDFGKSSGHSLPIRKSPGYSPPIRKCSNPYRATNTDLAVLTNMAQCLSSSLTVFVFTTLQSFLQTSIYSYITTL